MKKYITYIVSLGFLFLPLLAVATTGATTGITNPLGFSSVQGVVAQLLGYVVKIGGVVAIFALIYVGYLFVKAQGNPTELQSARKAFIGTIIGIAVLLGAQLIASIIVGTLNNLKA